MIRSDDEWLTLADEFYGGAITTNGWHRALAGLASATGSRSGELIYISADGTTPTHVVTNVDPEALQHFDQIRAGMPQINPRVHAGFSARVLEPVTEADFITPEDQRRHPHYREFAFRWDLAFICLTTLYRDPGMTIGMSVIRSQTEGHINEDQKRIFSTLTPHVRAAIRMQQLLGANAAGLLTGALDAMNLPAFVLDGNGRVQRMTQSAEKLVADGGLLRLRNGFLGAFSDVDDRALTTAIEQAARGLERPSTPLSKSIIIKTGEQSLTVDVMPLPKAAAEFYMHPRVVVVARGEVSSDARRAQILTSIYGFTAAETQVALLLAHGKSADAIARERQVAIGTVRAQIKSLLAKFGVGRQIELVARLASL